MEEKQTTTSNTVTKLSSHLTCFTSSSSARSRPALSSRRSSVNLFFSVTADALVFVQGACRFAKSQAQRKHRELSVGDMRNPMGLEISEQQWPLGCAVLLPHGQVAVAISKSNDGTADSALC
jgi:hypothetical protein